MNELNLHGQMQTADSAKGIYQTIAIHQETLQKIILSNNDLRGGMNLVLQKLLELPLPQFQILDIVDNNIDQSDPCWPSLAQLIKTKLTLTEVYIGARRIMGSSSGIHTYYDQKVYDDLVARSDKPYHNTWWPDRYYGTGFNELVCWSEKVLMEALQLREQIGQPLAFFYYWSGSRTNLQISCHPTTRVFSYDRTKQNRFTYTKEEYIRDNNISNYVSRYAPILAAQMQQTV